MFRGTYEAYWLRHRLGHVHGYAPASASSSCFLLMGAGVAGGQQVMAQALESLPLRVWRPVKFLATDFGVAQSWLLQAFRE